MSTENHTNETRREQKHICDDCTSGFVTVKEPTFCPFCGGNNVR